jgi:hypothetical protein
MDLAAGEGHSFEHFLIAETWLLVGFFPGALGFGRALVFAFIVLLCHPADSRCCVGPSLSQAKPDSFVLST